MMHVPQGDTYYIMFTTRAFSTGAPTALTSGTFSVYEEATATPIQSTQALTASVNSVTGLNRIAVVATSGNGYDIGSYYSVVLDAGTVDSVSVVGEVVGHFRVIPPEVSAGIPDVNTMYIGDTAQTGNDVGADVDTLLTRIVGTLAAGTHNPQSGDAYGVVNDGTFGNAQLVRSTTPANTLDVSATGEAGIDWNNVGTPGATVDLSATSINLADTVTTLTGHTPQTGDSFARIGATGSGLTSLAQASVATEGRLAELDAGNLPTDIATIDGIVDTLLLGVITGTTSGTPTVTSSNTNLTGYADDELIGRVIIFTGGTADGQAARITDYANTNGVVTYDEITTAPAASDTFKIV